MFDTLTLVVRAYTRAFVSQGVGIIGLVWCLAEGQAALAMALTLLVLADQAIFMRDRRRRAAPAFRFQWLLDGWCYAVSGLDVLIGLAAVIRAGGLRDGAGGALTTAPLDSLAYVMAAVTHGPTSFVPATPGGRLLGAALAAAGAVAFLAALAAIVLRRRSE
jgi:hypothetical protein